MRDFVSKFLSKAGAVVLVMALITGIAVAGSILFNNSEKAYASCSGQVDYPNTAVIYCGLSGGSANADAQDLKTNYYDKNTDGRIGHEHHDIQSFFNGKHLTGSVMADGHWAMAHTDLTTKHIILNSNNSVVGTATAVYARCTSDGDPHCALSQSGTIMSTPDFYFGKFGKTMPTIVHLKSDGTADFALETPCGNFIMFTPTPPTPKSSLVCHELDSKFDQDGDTFNYTFTVTATAKNTSKITYTINFGDGSNSSKSVSNGTTVVTFNHPYVQLETNKDYTISAKVNDQSQVPACQTVIHIPAKGKLSFACKQLVATLIDQSSDHRAYSFEALTQGTDTAKSYQFVFINTDGSQVKLDAQSSNTTSHTYTIDASKAQEGKAYFVATSQTGLTTDVNDRNCQFEFTTQLIRTGPAGTFGLVAIASTLGYGMHQLFIRRKLSA